MARTKVKVRRKHLSEEIDVDAFKDIHIRFHGDTYILAVWLALADRARSTPTCKSRTTLHGLALKFAQSYGHDDSNPLTREDVMDQFRQHGITGNPVLRLEATSENNSGLEMAPAPGQMITIAAQSSDLESHQTRV